MLWWPLLQYLASVGHRDLKQRFDPLLSKSPWIVIDPPPK